MVPTYKEERHKISVKCGPNFQELIVLLENKTNFLRWCPMKTCKYRSLYATLCIWVWKRLEVLRIPRRNLPVVPNSTTLYLWYLFKINLYGQGGA